MSALDAFGSSYFHRAFLPCRDIVLILVFFAKVRSVYFKFSVVLAKLDVLSALSFVDPVEDKLASLCVQLGERISNIFLLQPVFLKEKW